MTNPKHNIRKDVIKDLWHMIRCSQLLTVLKDINTTPDNFDEEFFIHICEIYYDKKNTLETIGGFSVIKWNTVTENELLAFREHCIRRNVTYALITIGKQEPNKYHLSQEILDDITELDEPINDFNIMYNSLTNEQKNDFEIRRINNNIISPNIQ